MLRAGYSVKQSCKKDGDETDKQSILEYALRSREDDTDILKLLLESGDADLAKFSPKALENVVDNVVGNIVDNIVDNVVHDVVGNVVDNVGDNVVVNVVDSIV